MYYTGISGMQSFDPSQGSQPFAQLGQSSYNLGTAAPAVSGSKNPITNTAPQAQSPNNDNNLMFAKSITDVPTEVQQSAQPYMGGTSSYGDPSQSLFGRNLTSNYNNWTAQYGQTGQQFMPWALRQGQGGGNYDPSQVDLFNPLAGKSPSYSFNPGAGSLMSTNKYFNPVSGANDQAAQALESNNPAYQLSRNYQDITPDYIKQQFGNWTKMGATGLPTATNYANDYYKSLMPDYGSSAANGLGTNQLNGFNNWNNWYNTGVGRGFLDPSDPSYHNIEMNGNLVSGPGAPTMNNLGLSVYRG